jgi:hypothetical protein
MAYAGVVDALGIVIYERDSATMERWVDTKVVF